MKLRLFLLLTGTLFTSSCFLARTRSNEPFPQQALEALTLGETTALEAVEQLGAPLEVVQLGRRSAYRYQYGVAKRTGLFLIVVTFLEEDTQSDRLWLFFDEEDRLTHYATSYEAEGAEYGLPFGED